MSRDRSILPKDILIHSVSVAAAACEPWVGKGDGYNADLAAVGAIRGYLNKSNINGIIKIGEGERDNAPMLHNGEIVGNQIPNNVEIDIAVDPLEGTNFCQNGSQGALSVMCMANRGCILSAPDVYMNKIATCHNIPNDLLNIEFSIKENLEKLSDFLGKPIKDLKVCVLNRERHEHLVHAMQNCNVTVHFIDDGDVLGIMQTSAIFGSEFDLYIGTGGAPEGVLAASFISAVGGFFQGKMAALNAKQVTRLKNYKLDSEKVYNAVDLVNGDTLFAISFITGTTHKEGVQILKEDLNEVLYNVNVFTVGKNSKPTFTKQKIRYNKKMDEIEARQ